MGGDTETTEDNPDYDELKSTPPAWAGTQIHGCSADRFRA